MTKVAVYREPADPEAMPYRAVACGIQAKGRTAGEALDALASQLPGEGTDTLVIVRNMGADRFFSDEQRRRLEDLMSRRSETAAKNTVLKAEDQHELEDLVDAEVQAATARAWALINDLTR